MSFVKPAAVALTVAAVMTTAGCGDGKSGSAGATPSSSPSVSESTGGGAGGATVGASTAPSHTATSGSGGSGSGDGGTPAAISRCRTAGLSAVVTGYDAGAGQRYARLVLTNTSGHSCRMYGWPGLGLGNQNEGFGTTVVRTGTASTIVLAVGGKAYTRLHWAAVPADDETGAQCEPTATVLQVIPPDETAPVVATWSGGPVCQHNRIETTAAQTGTGA
ncbi:DUF4232 domain-containing protein [Actinomadura syzygii]|uniref:DUF4232 domain-containing protein n=1 Tax=Actinomadura syzygii TaxID=1427538 RepID=A0A5D0UMQ0_9ACTN|nr:DUF4232 domain-containing protein [Actinomadura syzygii]TYC18853.1 DUF4232 domain-containing protein [Actinomadura syzygii]